MCCYSLLRVAIVYITQLSLSWQPKFYHLTLQAKYGVRTWQVGSLQNVKWPYVWGSRACIPEALCFRNPACLNLGRVVWPHTWMSCLPHCHPKAGDPWNTVILAPACPLGLPLDLHNDYCHTLWRLMLKFFPTKCNADFQLQLWEMWLQIWISKQLAIQRVNFSHLLCCLRANDWLSKEMITLTDILDSKTNNTNKWFIFSPYFFHFQLKGFGLI
jgi:hypothetical protein